MGKSHKKRKRQLQAQQRYEKDETASREHKEQEEEDEEEESSSSPTTETISDHDLAITIHTLQRLTPQLFRSKRCKMLRKQLHPFIVQQMKDCYTSVDYRTKTTLQLQRQNYAAALACLQACRDFQQIPKQGTIQRWVRDCSQAPPAVQMKLLQGILSVGQPEEEEEDQNRHNPSNALAQLVEHNVTIVETWKWWEDDQDEGDEEEDNSTASKAVVNLPPLSLDTARVVYREAPATRTPPNHYELILHGNVNITWESTATAPSPQKIKVPFLPTPARVLSSVLTASECQQLIRLLTHLEFCPDHPVDATEATGIDGCQVMMTHGSNVLFQRVQQLLPATLTVRGGHSAVRLHSINPRWRGFRYNTNATYRPHVDGSWPLNYMQENGNDDETMSYQCEHQSPTKSYLTFLLYLNDDFEGGETRFYLPHQLARGIAPRAGCVTVFPQGNMASLIHEGAKVAGGVKYVIRTDVLYTPINV